MRPLMPTLTLFKKMAKDSFDSWEKFLNPDELKSSLIRASIYLSAYELFKNSIIDHSRGFFASEWKFNDKTGEIETIISKSYKDKVRSLYPKDEFHSCCLWFFENKAMSQQDLDSIAKIRKHRNSIAHELPKYLGSVKYDIDTNLLKELIGIIRKVDTWWLREIEIPTNPDFDHIDYDDIRWDEVLSGNMIMMNFLASIYEGDDAYLKAFHNEFVERWNKLKG
jgi:hypothetical protein